MASSNKTEDTTTYTDADTGLKINLLQGQVNFTRWYKEVQLAAEGKDVWLLILDQSSADAEAILVKPVRPAKPNAADAKYQFRGTRSTDAATQVAAEATLQELYRTDYNNYTAEVSEYKLDHDAYNDQQERVRKARTLLLSTVDPAIRDTVSTNKTPAAMMTAIRKLCEMSPGQTRTLIHREIDALTFTKCGHNVSTLINTLTSYKKDLEANEGTFGDDQIVNTTLKLLPAAYDDFKRHWARNAGSPATPLSVANLHQSLLHEHALLDAEGKLNFNSNSIKKKGDASKKNNKENKGDEEEKPKHRCKHCNNMVLHKEENCWKNPGGPNYRPNAKIGDGEVGKKKQATLATATGEDVDELAKKIKNKVNIVATVMADRDAFDQTMQDNFAKAVDNALATPPSLTAYRTGVNSHTRKRSVVTGFATATEDAAAMQVLSYSKEGPVTCITCNTIGFHTTEDHDFAIELSRIQGASRGKNDDKLQADIKTDMSK